MKSYDDTLFSMPWRCDDKDCSSEWHQATYWIYCRGKRTSYSVDWYTDGDHESCGKRDLPSYDDVDKAWREYSQYVLETGTDPLGEFYVKRSTRGERKWRIHFRWSIVGMIVVCGRTEKGRYMPADKLPKYVQDFLGMDTSVKARHYTADCKPEDLLGPFGMQHPGCRVRGLDYFWSGSIEHEEPRSEQAVRQDLIRAARKHLAQPK